MNRSNFDVMNATPMFTYHGHLEVVDSYLSSRNTLPVLKYARHNSIDLLDRFSQHHLGRFNLYRGPSYSSSVNSSVTLYLWKWVRCGNYHNCKIAAYSDQVTIFPHIMLEMKFLNFKRRPHSYHFHHRDQEYALIHLPIPIFWFQQSAESSRNQDKYARYSVPFLVIFD